eukprot:jgi/Ulvmu1/1303/UM011_0030.1
MFTCSLVRDVARRALDARCTNTLARAASSITQSEYERLCSLSYWQNEHYDGLNIEPLPRLLIDSVPVVHHPLYSAPQLRDGHRFPMRVFQTIHDILLEEGVAHQDQILYPSALPSLEMLHLAHDVEYASSFLGGSLSDAQKRRIGFQDSVCESTLINRTLWEVSGTLLTAHLALEHGLACNTAGGTHHAQRAAGSGFCIINDLAITALALPRASGGRVRRVLVLDLDVHQGDGTAQILRGAEPGVTTVSVHAARNFPARKQPSTLDVGLSDGVADTEYLRVVDDVLEQAIELSAPDICLYDAGVDPHVEDDLGRLCLTTDGLFQRDKIVLERFWRKGIPVAGYVGGGYHRDLRKLAGWHTLLHRAAADCWRSL